MMKVLLAALLAGVASSAYAADLPSHKAPPAPAPYYAPQAFSWTGFYVGLNGGWAGGSTGGDFGSPSGGLVGGTAGYNYQIGQFVLGAETDFDWADLHKSGINLLGAYNNNIDSLFTARARAGIALDRALIFATAGYAGVEDNVSYPGLLSSSDWRSGGAFGGGIEYAFTNNISAKAEYLYMPFANKSYSAGGTTQTSDLNLSVIRAGLNYKF
ncbi:MAG: porin family protein [Bradyrhizobium sp.]|nr:MAG: porin family protein [Bradyrhizobium sp.]